MVAVDVRSIALFFFFALMDEKLALAASIKSVKLYRKQAAKTPEIPSQILLIRAILNVWNIERKSLSRGRQTTVFSKLWAMPPQLDLNPWKEFQKQSPNEELLSILFVTILGFKASDVAQAMNLSEGSIKYRLSKALSRLGEYSENPFNPSPQKSRLGLVRS
jgi:hypothetical protein